MTPIPSRRLMWAVMAAVAVLAVAAYLPALKLPFISDDYVQIDLGRKFGPVSGWGALVADPLYRCRATSLVLTYWTDRVFGLNPTAFNASSLALHIVNALLIFSLGAWPVIGWRIAALAACFFAVYEGHQEAVIWYAALPELLVFFFSLVAVHCWLRWIRQPHWMAWAATLAAFVLALGSKESAVAVPPLLVLVARLEKVEWRRIAAAVAPFLFLSGVYFGLAFAARTGHLHFNDGTFSLSAPFWVAWTRSFFRLLWFWGLAGLAVLWKYRNRSTPGLLGFAGIWIGVALLPYSFLTYMPRVPSRHTYFASLGAALVVAAALQSLAALQRRPWVAPALAGCIVLHNCGYLWAVKQQQFRERAEPTELLLRQVRHSSGQVSLECFPYSYEVADAALRLYGREKDVARLVPARSTAGVSCQGRWTGR